jgi:hypothetical protein
LVFAKNLEALLIRLYGKGDVSRPVVDDMAQRFEALRRYRRLPHGRERRAQPLNNQEIAAAILGLTPVSASWAGHVALVLGDLRPVGGSAASFFEAETLSAAIGYRFLSVMTWCDDSFAIAHESWAGMQMR